MSVGGVFLLIAAVLFLANALGAAWFAGMVSVGLFCLALGVLLNGVPIRRVAP